MSEKQWLLYTKLDGRLCSTLLSDSVGSGCGLGHISLVGEKIERCMTLKQHSILMSRHSTHLSPWNPRGMTFWAMVATIYCPILRRQRWNQWLKIAEKVAPDQADYWRDHGECVGCKHHDGEWCQLMELPVTVNPYWTMKKRMGIGMACMGAGREKVEEL